MTTFWVKSTIILYLFKNKIILNFGTSEATKFFPPSSFVSVVGSGMDKSQDQG